MYRLPPLLLLSCISLSAQSAFEYWPGAKYDPQIPTIRKVLGYEPGDRITPHSGLIRYLEALAAAAPDRIKVFDYAESWEGRKLVYAAVGSPANIARLGEIRDGMKRLAAPAPGDNVAGLIGKLPAVVWLGYGVHGNEISSPDAALLTAYHLVASRGDSLVDNVLANTLVLIDPTQNPDGRDRFVNYFQQARGAEPNASPLSAEHNEPWPMGRTNHYLFDLNRDWLTGTQPESIGRIRVLREWYPLVFVDLHEMGSDGTYYFAPEADPYNPHLAKEQRDSLQLFGRNNAKWFDKNGFDYFTREVYDAFYPGYGASWPSYYGSVAMTYEQASVRGLVIRKSDASTVQFRDSVREHFVASVSTCETAANNREKLLRDFRHYRETAIAEGSKEPIREYILVRGADWSAADKLAGILVRHGIEVRRATAAFRAGDREIPAGSYTVSLAQPSKRFIRTLLDADTPMTPEFLKEQERRRARKLPHEIYDITAWSLPLLFNVEAIARPEISKGNFEPAGTDLVRKGTVKGGKASVAYLVPWGSSAGRLLAAAYANDLHVWSSDKPFAINGTAFPAGTLIFKVHENPVDLHDKLSTIAASSGADVYATDTGWVDSGVNFGSRYVFPLRKPEIAMAWDLPTNSSSAGWTRFVLERQFEYPVTPIRTAQLGSADVSRFHVIILPDVGPGRGYAETLGVAGVAHLKEWVAAGGTLIGLAGAVGFLADPKTGLLAVTRENKPSDPPKDLKKPETAADGTVPGKLIASETDLNKAIQAEKESPDVVPGVILKARVDPEYWIAAGMGQSVYAMFSGRSVFTPVALDKGVNAAVFESPDKVVAGGYIWGENRKQIANKPLVIVEPQGRGLVIGFTTDPNFRGYLDGMNMMFLNAVFRGPAHARPMTSR